VARGLAHAHSRGVIHRDLTPGNVFLCADGQVKVLDFGMAHGLGWRKLEGGTRAYMAPEQDRGAPEDERTDVFALGVILFEMLAGEVPFRDARGLRGAAPAPRLGIAAAPGLAELVARMLEKDPVARPRDGGEVAEALASFATASRPTPGPEGPVRVRRRWITPRRAGLVAAGALLAAALAYWQSSKAPPPPAPATQAAPIGGPAPGPPPPEPQAESAPPPKPPAPAPAQTPTRKLPRVRACREGVGALATPPASSGEGVIAVEADPFAEVFIGGRLLGETPIVCRVAAGSYRVRAVHPTLGERTRLVVVHPGEPARWAADFLGGR
jgi:hypothetical protein